MWVAVIPSKDRVAATIKEIQSQAEGESRVKLMVIHTDQGGEFMEYYVTEGVHR
jgi:hypothetical protein